MPAHSASVSFTGVVANLCVLTVSTPGALGISSDGRALASSETGGVKAVMAVSATGTNPSITFTAPQLAGPAGSISGASSTLAYSSPGGANQAATSAAATMQLNRLLDVVTVDGRVTNSNGFAAGTYTLSTTATCQQ